MIFAHFSRRSLAIFDRREIANLGASRDRAILQGAVRIAAATAEIRAILVHSPTGGTHTSKAVVLEPHPLIGFCNACWILLFHFLPLTTHTPSNN